MSVIVSRALPDARDGLKPVHRRIRHAMHQLAMTPHNLGEVVDACLALIDNPEIGLDELLDIVPGPDFPTGAEIIGRSGARNALMTGRGSVIMRAVNHIEELRKDREAIIFTAIPYQ